MLNARASRRRFLADVGRGMLVAGLGYGAALELRMTPAWAAEGPERLTFGDHERLVSLMQETPPDQLLPKLVDLIRQGTDLRELVGAASLANARAFGGEDYIGFHTFMAMMPAYRMSESLPSERRALPVLKVLYRNATRLQEAGHATSDVLHPVDAAGEAPESPIVQAIRDAVHRGDHAAAERALAAAVNQSAETAWNDMLPTVHEAPEVHRIVLAHRAWDMLGMVGMEHAATMLRQSVRFCIKGEEARARHSGHLPDFFTRTLEQHKLLDPQLGTRVADDAWIENMVATLGAGTAEQAADAMAAALAEGMSLESLSEALALTANQLVLRDAGRPPEWAQPNKPVGSVHGDSIGVHASDSANAWRHVARVSNPRNAAASLVIGAFHVARDYSSPKTDFRNWQPRPLAEDLEQITTDDPSRLLTEIDGAIRDKDQDRACAVVHKYLESGHSERPVFDVLLRHSTSEDGALHAEKYFWTVNDEFALTRPAFRNRQVVALARVVASEYGTRAPGYEEACGLLGCEV